MNIDARKLDANHQSQAMSQDRSRYLSAAISAVLTLAAAGAHADPRSGVVVSGSATISTPGAGLTQIDQTSHTTSINWESFDVTAQERVIFNQPSSTSVALNRILDQNPSQIHGSIDANGRVFLLNPNGIIFGALARINVGSLVATSLDLISADDSSGRYTFGVAGQGGAIVNDGQITAADGGSVTLLGSSVRNNGLISANLGSVNLAAGRAATLDFMGDGLMRFQIDAGLLTDASGAAVSNTGQIIADGGQVVLTARQANDVIARAVNNDGVIRAARVDNVGGRIFLVGPEGSVVNTGTLDARGVGVNSTGGEVQVLGTEVTLTGTTVIDVSGDAGGGSAFIGGGFKGADPNLLNAQNTTVQAGAVIRADSNLSGDAGQVAVWSDGTTQFDGDIFARAFGSSGDGGQVEVSGREHLSITGHAYLHSANGKAGSLLLDPGSITIIDGGNTGPSGDMDTIRDGWIIDQLDNGSGDLIIQTDDSDNGEDETLEVENDVNITWNSANSLILRGDDSVTLRTGSVIANDGTGGLTLESDGEIAIRSTITLATGNLAVTAGGGILQNGGSMAIGGDSVFTAGEGESIDLQRTGNDFTGDVQFASGGPGNLQDVSIIDSSALDLQALALDGALSVTANGITQSGGLTITGNATFTANAGQSITLDRSDNTFNGAVDFNVLGGIGSLQNVSIRDQNALALQALTIGGNLTVFASSITQSGLLNITGNSSFTGTTGGSVLLGLGNTFTGTVNVLGTGLVDVTLRDTTALNLQALTIGGNLSVQASTITQSGGLDITGVATFTANAGQSITLGRTDNSFGGAVSFVASGIGNLQNVTIYDSTALQLQALTLSGNLDARSRDQLTQAGVLDIDGTSLFGAGVTGDGIILTAANVFTGAVDIVTTAPFNLQRVTINNTIALDLAGFTLDGDLIATASSISQSGALDLGGDPVFTVANGQSVILDHVGNTIDGAITVNASSGTVQNVTLVNTQNLFLQPMTITGNLIATAGGQIGHAGGSLNIGGTSAFTAGQGQSITLDSTSNIFSGAVSFASGGPGALDSILFVDSTALDLQALSVSGGLTIRASSLTQSGAASVGGAASFTVDSGQSILLGQANTFSGNVTVAAASGTLQNVTLRDTTALSLDALTIAGNLNMRGGSAVGQTGAFNIGGTSTFTADQGGAITIDDPGNIFSGAMSFLSAGPGNLQTVNVLDTTALVLQTIAVNGDLTANSGASLTQSGVLTVGGNAAFTAAAGQSITLDDPANTFTGTVLLSSGGPGSLQNVSIADSNALILQPLTITGNLTARASSLTQTGALSIGGNSSFTAANGQSITVNSGTNVFTGTVNFAASSGTLQSVSVLDTTALSLSAINVSDDLTVVAGGTGITQTGALTVGDDATFTVDGGQSITLDDAGNNFGGDVSFVASSGTLQDVTVVDTGALTLQLLTLTGDLDVTASSIGQTGALTIGGNASFTGGNGGVISLGAQPNSFAGTLTIGASSGTLAEVALRDITALALPAITVTGNLTARTDALLTQSGPLSVGGNTSLLAGAGQSITLTNSSNAFQGTVTWSQEGVSGLLQDVTLTDSTALNLESFSIDGNLTIVANSITQGATMDVGGDASFTAANGQSIILNGTNQLSGDVSFAASSGALQNVTVYNQIALDLRALSIAGNLNVQAQQITQSGALDIDGTSSFTAFQNQSVILDRTDNAFGGAVSFTSTGPGLLSSVTVFDTTSLELGASQVSGTLVATTGGSLTQSAELIVGGNATFTAAAGQSITLDDVDNAFAGTVTFASSGPGTLQNVTVVDSTALDLQTLTLAGNLNASALSLTQSTVLSIGGTATFRAAGGQSIVLDRAGNVFTGTVNVAASSGTLQNVVLADSTALDLQALTVAGDLGVTATTLTQSGALVVGGNAAFTAGSGQSIILGEAGNNFTGAVSFASASPGDLQDVTVVDSSALQLQGMTISGDLNVTASSITQSGALGIGGNASFTAANGQSIILDDANNTFFGAVNVTASSGNLLNVTLADFTALQLQALTITGNLTVRGDSLSQAGPLSVGGASTFTASAGQSIVYDNPGNAFAGPVSFASIGPGNLQNITVVNSGALDLQGLNINGNLVADATSIAQSGALLVNGTSSFTAAGGQSIVLDNAGNGFTGNVSLAASGAGNLLNVTLVDSTALNLQALTIDGDLSVSAQTIAQSGALNVGGTSSFAANANRFIILDRDNVLTGAVTFAANTTGNLETVVVVDQSALDLQALTVTGDLNVIANSLTQSGALSVGDVATFYVADGQSISLGNTTNVFTGSVDIGALGGAGLLQSLTLADATDLQLSGVGTSGDMIVTTVGSLTDGNGVFVGGNATFTAGAGQSITLDSQFNTFNGSVSFASGGAGSLQDVTIRDTGAFDLQALTLAGNLNARTGASLTQSGALNVGGNSTFTAGAGESIILDNVSNSFAGTVTFVSAGPGNLQNVAIADSSALDLQALTIAGSLSASGDSLTQSGALSIGGAATFAAANGQSITLTNANNVFSGAVNIAARSGTLQNVAVTDSTSLELQALALAGNLAATSGVALTQSGPFIIGGNAVFTAGAGQSIVLGNVNNDFGGAVSFVSGGPGNLQNVTVVDSTALQLQALTLDGALNVTAGSITQSGALVIGGNSSFTAAGGQSIVLDNAGNVFTGAVNLAASSGTLQNVSLTDSTALDLQALTVVGDLAATSAVTLTQSGALVVGGNAVFTTAAGQSITLTNASNDFGGSVSFLASGAGTLQNVSVVDSSALDLQALTLAGNLNVTASSISQSGALVIGGNASFTAGNGQGISLGSLPNSFAGTVSVTASVGTLSNVQLRDITALDLSAMTLTGSLLARTDASLTQSGALSIGGDATFRAGTGQSITLTNAGNAFQGAVSWLAEGAGNLQNVSLTDSTALQLQSFAIDGNLAIAASSVTQAGAMSVGGTSSFAAANGQSIVLDAVNSFGGAVSFAAITGSLQNVTVRNATALDLQALSIGGNLNVTALRITQSGALDIDGTATFTANAGEFITLDHANNAFTGAVNFVSAGPGNLQNVTVRDSDAFDLQALAIDGALSATSGGVLTQSGDLNIGGAASFMTLNTAGAGITLGGNNSFGSVQAATRNAADTANSSASIVINESNDTSLGNVRTAGGVTVTSTGSIAGLASTSVDAGLLSLVATNNIDVSSAGDLRVADVRAGGSLTLISGGSIFDDNVNGAGSQLVANSLTLQAAQGIGEAAGVGNGMLDLQVASVGANAQGGGLYLEQAQGNLNIRQLAAAGPVSILATAGSIADDANDASAASVTSTAGGVQLRALNNIGAITDLATRQGSAITVDTNGGALSAQVTNTTGQVNLAVAGGSALTAGSSAISGGGSGQLLIQSAGDLSLAGFNSAIAGFGAVGISSNATLTLPDTGSITNGTVGTLLIRGATDVVRTGRTLDFAADRLVFESGSAGGDTTLNTDVDLLDATIGNGANLSVVQTAGNLTLGSLTSGGSISVRASTILDDGDSGTVTRVTAANGITLQASNGIGAADGTSGGRIDTASQSVTVLADAGAVFVSHQGNLQVSGTASNGSIDIIAATGNITVNSNLQASGALTLTAGTDAAVAGNIVLSSTARAGSVMTLNARGGGAISDPSDATTHLFAGDAVLAATQIGSTSNLLNVDVGSLTATAPNGVYVNEANALQLRSITGSNVTISAAGEITDDSDTQTRITAGTATLAGSAIGTSGNGIDTSATRLSATASNGGIYVDQTGDIELASLSASGTANDIGITVSGAISDDGDNATRIAGGNLVLSAASIGAAAAGADVDTQVTSLTATASSGGIYIADADALQLNTITAAGNDVVLSAGGALADDGNDATRVTGANVFLTGSAVGATDNRVDTAAGNLSVTATNGGIYIDEADNVTLADIRSSGAGNTVNLRTGNNGNIIVQSLVTQGGAVNLTSGGTGSLNVTGTLESNNGLVTLISGDLLGVPGLNTGTGTATLHTVNDAVVGTITAGIITISSDQGNVLLGTANAGTGTVDITALNGTIVDNTDVSVTAGQATLTARSIGSADNPLNMSVGTLTATTSAGGIFIDNTVGLTVADINAAGIVSLRASGAFNQTGTIESSGNAISVFANSITMDSLATTLSNGADITYAATADDANIAVLDAGTGRILVIAADNVFSTLASASAINNLSAAAVEIRAAGFAPGSGQIGTLTSPLAIDTPSSVGRNVFLIVPAANGIQRTTPHISYTGVPSSLLLKGYTGTTGALMFDLTSTFSSETFLLNGESIVPLLNGRVAVNTDSLSAAKQALSSGVVGKVNIDWAAFDPNVSLFGTVDPAVRLPADQLDEVVP